MRALDTVEVVIQTALGTEDVKSFTSDSEAVSHVLPVMMVARRHVTAMNHRHMVSYGAAGGGAQKCMMASEMPADTADRRAAQASGVRRAGSSDHSH